MFVMGWIGVGWDGMKDFADFRSFNVYSVSVS